MNSIRQTLLWRLFGGALLLLLAGAVLLYFGAGWLLTRQFDSTLQAKLETIEALADEEGYDIELGFDEKAMPEFFEAANPEYFELWLTDGQVLFRSPSLGSRADLPMRHGEEQAALTWDLVLPDGRAGRAIGADFVVHKYEPAEDDPGPAHVVLVLAKERRVLDRALTTLLGGTIAGILLLLGGGWFVGRGAVARGLRPLEDMARHVSAVDDPVRASRFPAETVPAELAPLAESHNAMLDRIRLAFERERRTTANIAHELRTPVSELVMLTEDAARGAHDPAETARRLEELREIGGRMSTLISTLLQLARMESGRTPLEIEAIDLVQMVRDCWSALVPLAEAKGIELRLSEDCGTLVQADRAALSILLSNLLSNAIEHAPAGDEIGCDLWCAETRAFLLMTNTANGVTSTDIDKLTEPFWRLNSSRTDPAHAGLGLSLVARLATLLGLELSFRVDAEKFKVELGFPFASREAERMTPGRRAASC